MAPTVAASVADTGTETLVTVTGGGPGRHLATLRMWPGGRELHDVEFDEAGLEVRFLELLDRGIATVDGGDEIRFDVAPA